MASGGKKSDWERGKQGKYAAVLMFLRKNIVETRYRKYINKEGTRIRFFGQSKRAPWLLCTKQTTQRPAQSLYRIDDCFGSRGKSIQVKGLCLLCFLGSREAFANLNATAPPTGGALLSYPLFPTYCISLLSQTSCNHEHSCLLHLSWQVSVFSNSWLLLS